MCCYTAAVRHRVPDGKFCCWFIEFDSSAFKHDLKKKSTVPLGSTVAFTALPILQQYILGNFGHARRLLLIIIAVYSTAHTWVPNRITTSKSTLVHGAVININNAGPLRGEAAVKMCIATRHIVISNISWRCSELTWQMGFFYRAFCMEKEGNTFT